MAKLYYDKDADLSLLKGKTIAVIGYGSQGHAHALNLRDAGFTVVVGLYRGSKSWDKAAGEGLTVMPVAEAASAAHTIMILLPDQHQRQVYVEAIQPGLTPGKTLMFAHGFNIHFHQVVPPQDIEDIVQATYVRVCQYNSRNEIVGITNKSIDAIPAA